MNNDKALLNPAPPAGEEQRVEAVFGMAKEMIGYVPAGMRLYGISPPLLESFGGTVGYFRNGTELSPLLTTMIRYLGSERAGCKFCVDMNEGFLTSMGVDLDVARAAQQDIERAPVEVREMPLLKLAMHAVTDPDEDASPLIDDARQAGWDDRELFDAVLQAVSNRAFNFVLKTFNVETQEAFV